ncbi:hypothetical protein [Clostridium massiliodielmoense]|uniref:hypothetical protein n=1 Tax=Clostridium massiliodielmoense TaxID=1776385 RepID=UPI0001668683|nr:hypothetical protein [Clostridium massiliodielmoense]EDS77785.1 conserved hypothetical protein [Clostridium botulinum C str. Eklund]KEH97116.1 hypothetical protein Z962_04790 [Clostridium botulinum C/D str. BKT12695]NEZ49570.1 hypothetical protein [Clostridium botulinum]
MLSDLMQNINDGINRLLYNNFNNVSDSELVKGDITSRVSIEDIDLINRNLSTYIGNVVSITLDDIRDDGDWRRYYILTNGDIKYGISLVTELNGNNHEITCANVRTDENFAVVASTEI